MCVHRDRLLLPSVNANQAAKPLDPRSALESDLKQS
jgi:hypothetical protein